jgi:hypothetical protein
VVSQAGGVLLLETVRKTGLDAALSAALLPWRKPRAVHDPGKVLLDLALAVAMAGDCLSDVAVLRAEPQVFGPVASDPTVSRLIDTLSGAGPRALAAIRRARGEVRERVWKLAGTDAPNAGGQLIVDIDGVLVRAHSEKQDATATWKKTFGHQYAMRRSNVSPAEPGGTWKEVPGPDGLPDPETVTGQEHVRKLAAVPRRYGRCARWPA